MSRAFVKDYDEADPVDDLADRLVSTHPNLVTAAGLARIEAEITRLHEVRERARADADKAALDAAARDLRYWQARHATAQVQPAPATNERVQFGSAVTIARADGRVQTFRVVGEDEADPAEGTVSYISPLARAVTGKQVGDAVRVAGDDVEVTAIN
jgi:transcription elongation GreA/GreB family factor